MEDSNLADIINDSDVPLFEIMAAYHEASEAETSKYIYTINETGGLISTVGARDVYTEAVGDVVDDIIQMLQWIKLSYNNKCLS